MDQRLPLRQVPQQLAAEPLLAHALRQARHVDVLHVGGHGLLRLEHLGQHVEPRVGHLDHRHVRLVLRGGVGARGRLRARQRVEDGRLAAARQPDDHQAQGHRNASV